MKYVFIADYVQIVGGAEANDHSLREFLGGEQVVIRSIDCSIDKLSKLRDTRIVISNFTALSQECKDYITKNSEYIIIEYDHKYLKTRNPSVFKDWKAPADQLQNLDFYRAAKSVICQTKQHQDVVILNTGLENTVNFGGSIWSNEQLDYIDSICGPDPTVPTQTAVLDSEIVHKGTRQAIEYAKNNNKTVKLLGVKDWKDFIIELSQCNELLFFPQVLETCSRIAVEARMIGLKVIGNNNLSALKEDWFKKYKGNELINYFREKNKTLKEFIDNCFTREIEHSVRAEQADITCILTLYRRPQNLQKQIDSIKAQTIPPKQIWVFWNYHEDTKNFDKNSIKGVDRWIQSDHNWKYFGRFALALMIETEYCVIYDDDTISGKKWHENCLESMKSKPGIMGGIGIRLNSYNYADSYRIGWAEPNEIIEEVDLVGHSWFMTREHIKNMWSIDPFSFENSEDIHLSMANYLKGIKTYVPPQLDIEKSSSLYGYELGTGQEASSHPSRHLEFYLQRNTAIEYAIKNGWNILKNRK